MSEMWASPKARVNIQKRFDINIFQNLYLVDIYFLFKNRQKINYLNCYPDVKLNHIL